ncbi:hypothetical protein [Cupriavidus alkaliphilus]|uniref:Uncharacterized protein n=1 Tax=Cupriavidus alkaliphilus TaxID=942866 RepID=A0A7W4VCB7_9BURK|nr:hypothetical protein [Cupriavidus alkaliphilus]MBB3008649.1 hypothetical protein [Cupriavidus alkaliphilus]PVY60752.1 hypothetical protein C7414_12420 [Cupriavidus alkaliphilus]
MTMRPPDATPLPAALVDTAAPAVPASSPAAAAHEPAPPARFARPTMLLETLLATRLELLSRDHTWPPHTLAQRRAVLMRLWEQRAPGLFEQGGTADSIARCLQAAFAEAAEGRRLEAALQFKRAYYLVCCTASSGSRARLHGGNNGETG